MNLPISNSVPKLFKETFFENDLFDSMLRNFSREFNNGLNTYSEDGKGYVVLQVPGFNKDNLIVEMSEGILTIKGERKDNFTGEEKIFKQITVGNAEDAKADIKDGILIVEISYPKIETKKIELNNK